MPLYEYECQQCRRHTEKRQKFSDPEITECPHCGGKLQRVLTAPAISFKGGGWYADGYGNSKPKPTGDAATGKAEGSGATPPASSPDSAGKTASSTESASTPAPTPAPATAAKS